MATRGRPRTRNLTVTTPGVVGPVLEVHPAGEIIVTLANTEKHYAYDRLSVEFDSTDQEILDALQPVLLEDEGFDITEEQEEGAYTLKRVTDSQNVYVFPKSTAGSWGLQTYSDVLRKSSVGVNIRAVENGYIFKLTGNVIPGKRAVFNEEYVDKEFVYANLQEGLTNLDTFFKNIEDTKDVKDIEIKVQLNGNIVKIMKVYPDEIKDTDRVTVMGLEYIPNEIRIKPYTVNYIKGDSINFVTVEILDKTEQ